MKQFDPFPPVNCTYGAPMGRRSDPPANLRGVKRLHARRQGGGNGYDRGGAYWGTPANVWAVWAHIDGKIVCTYVRANSRADAIAAVFHGRHEPEASTANARLIAAAPDLLAALEAIDSMQYSEVCNEAKDIARAAIAKARGE